MATRPQERISRDARILFFMSLAVLLACGCTQAKLIPNTKVADTPLNREILRVMEKYRLAVMESDPAAVLSLVHPTYFDNSGTPTGVDDIDYEGLKTLLKGRYRNTTKIRLRIEYLEVQSRGIQAQVDTWIDATFLYLQPGANPRWQRLTDANRFRLIKEKGSWMFISGL